MKRFRFPLERIRQLRAQSKRWAEAEQRRRRAELDAVTQELSSVEDELARLSSRCCRSAKGNEFLADRAMQESLMRLVFQLRKEANAARDRWDAARQEYGAAATELEKMESLRHAAWEEYHDRVKRADQKELDELVIRKWHRR